VIWLALIPAAVVLFVGSWLSYHPTAKESRWFPWVIVAVYVVNGLLWAWVAKRTPTKRELDSISVAWDVITIAAYNVLPIVAAGVKLSPKAWAGLAMVVIGAGLVKWGDE
jgi:multidrug transporter EmrE-like cation transporter